MARINTVPLVTQVTDSDSLLLYDRSNTMVGRITLNTLYVATSNYLDTTFPEQIQTILDATIVRDGLATEDYVDTQIAANRSVAVSFGDMMGDVATWAEGNNTGTIPLSKIPQLPNSRIEGLGALALVDNIDYNSNIITNKPGPPTLSDLLIDASVSEINILDGAIITTEELNYLDDVNRNVQTQLDEKAPLASPDFTGTLEITDNSQTVTLSPTEFVMPNLPGIGTNVAILPNGRIVRGPQGDSVGFSRTPLAVSDLTELADGTIPSTPTTNLVYMDIDLTTQDNFLFHTGTQEFALPNSNFNVLRGDYLLMARATRAQTVNPWEINQGTYFVGRVEDFRFNPEATETTTEFPTMGTMNVIGAQGRIPAQTVRLAMSEIALSTDLLENTAGLAMINDWFIREADALDSLGNIRSVRQPVTNLSWLADFNGLTRTSTTGETVQLGIQYGLDASDNPVQQWVEIDTEDSVPSGTAFPTSPDLGDLFILTEDLLEGVSYAPRVNFENYADVGGTSPGDVYFPVPNVNEWNIQISAERGTITPPLGDASDLTSIYYRESDTSDWVFLGSTVDSAVNGNQFRVRLDGNVPEATLMDIVPGYELGFQRLTATAGFYFFDGTTWTAASGGTGGGTFILTQAGIQNAITDPATFRDSIQVQRFQGINQTQITFDETTLNARTAGVTFLTVQNLVTTHLIGSTFVWMDTTYTVTGATDNTGRVDFTPALVDDIPGVTMLTFTFQEWTNAVAGSLNPTRGVIFDDASSITAVDSAISSTSTNPLENRVVQQALSDGLATKQDTLTIDTVPTDGSTNVIDSNAVFDGLALKQDIIGTYSETFLGPIEITAQFPASAGANTINHSQSVNAPARSTFTFMGTDYTVTASTEFSITFTPNLVDAVPQLTRINLNRKNDASINADVGITDGVNTLTLTPETIIPPALAGLNETGDVFDVSRISGADNISQFFEFQSVSGTANTWEEATTILFLRSRSAAAATFIDNTSAGDEVLAYIDDDNWAIYDVTGVEDRGALFAADTVTIVPMQFSGVPGSFFESTLYRDSNGVNVRNALSSLQLNLTYQNLTTSGTGIALGEITGADNITRRLSSANSLFNSEIGLLNAGGTAAITTWLSNISINYDSNAGTTNTFMTSIGAGDTVAITDASDPDNNWATYTSDAAVTGARPGFTLVSSLGNPPALSSNVTIYRDSNNVDVADGFNIYQWTHTGKIRTLPTSVSDHDNTVATKGFAMDARNFDFSNIPTSDPGVTGRIWNDGGVLRISS